MCSRSLIFSALWLGGSFLVSLPVLAASPAPGTIIENQSTGSFIDELDNLTKTVQSDKVIVTVAEVAGITVTTNGITGTPNPNSTIYYSFVITNVGNDPTQFFIPSLGNLTGNATQPSNIEITGYNLNGTTPVSIATPIVVPTGGGQTGSNGTTAGLLGANGGGIIQSGGSVTVRVPVKINATALANDPIVVRLGDTPVDPASTATPQARLENQVYLAGSNDVYTVDNPNSLETSAGLPINGDATNHRQEASAVQEVKVVISVPVLTISGTVFEDVNYGGGAGRSLTAATGVVRPNARVELYDATGAFKGFTTTTAAGVYTFDSTNITGGIAASNYYVRVVNSTVTSSRPGAVNTLLPVQTFRTNASTQTAIDEPNRVGGEKPSVADTGAAAAGAKLNTTTFAFTTAGGSALVGGQAESIAPVTLGISSITGIDFGYNFDTIVNTNDTGQGSLREFITNSNTLTNTGLAQVGQTPGKEVSIFMIPSGTATPGIQASVPSQLTSGIAKITAVTQLPNITDPNTTIDGTTQTTNVGDTNSGTAGTGGTVGTGGIALSTVNKPEVELNDGAASLSSGLLVKANNTTVRGLAIWGFGNGDDGSADILVGGLNSGCSASTIYTGLLFEQNLLGTGAAGFSAANTNATNNNGKGFQSSCGGQGTFQNNLVGFTRYTGAGWYDINNLDPNMNWTVTNNEFRSSGTGNLVDNVGIENFAKNVLLQGNLIVGAYANGVSLYNNVSSSNIKIDNNTVDGNGIGTGGFNGNSTEWAGIAIFTGSSGGVIVSRNNIQNNKGSGVWVSQDFSGIKITQNSMQNNGGLGIDLVGASNAGNQTIITGVVSPNDGTVGNSIANNGLDYPIITSSSLSGGTLTVKGYVGNNSAGSATFANLTLEFFIAADDGNNNGAVISGDGKNVPHGEGKTYIGGSTAGNLCTTNASGLFTCSFPNAGTVGLTSATNITATATDSTGNTSEFSAPASSNANVLLVKRITAINGDRTKNPNDNTPLNIFVDNPMTTSDNNSNWQNGLLIGALNAGKVKPGDKIEYTLYFMNANGGDVKDFKICDPIIGTQTFLPDAYGAAQDIKYSFSGSPEVALTKAVDPTIDRGQFNPSTSTVPGCTASTLVGTNNGTVIVDVTGSGSSAQSNPATMPGATAPATPNSYGYLRFTTTVKP